MNKILEALGEYIESIIEQKLANRPQHGFDPQHLTKLIDQRINAVLTDQGLRDLDPQHLTKLIDERIAAALTDQTLFVGKDAVRERIFDALKAHFDEAGVDMVELVEDVTKNIVAHSAFKPELERFVKSELREVIREEIVEAVGDHLKDNEGDLERGVEAFFDNEVDAAASLIRQAIRGFTITLEG